MSDIEKYESNQVLSEVSVFNGVVYLAGQVPNDDTLDIAGQSQEVFDNIDKQLAQAGTDKSRLLSAQVFLKNLEDFDEFNEMWIEWLKDVIPPTRATVQAQLVNPNWLIEVVVTAAT